MKYSDLRIASGDQAYIDSIAEAHNVDYNDCEIYPLGDITNQIIRYIIEDAINSLQVSTGSKDNLMENIYCNCIDSGINCDSSTFPKSERKAIQELIDSF
jgi:hypothetical protein